MRVRRAGRRGVVWALWAVGACGPSAERAPADSAPPAQPAADSVTYRGDGFALTLPPGSRVGRGGAAGDTLAGPARAEPGRSPDLGGPGPHPAFLLVVSALSRPGGVPLAGWVDGVRRARNAAAAEEARLPPAAPDSLGAEPALRLEPYCGDCDGVELYAARGERVVVLAYELGIHLAGSRDEQERAHRAVLSTFRWAP